MKRATIRWIVVWLRDLIFEPKGTQRERTFLKSDATKLIFDHVRNFTIAAVVAQAGLVALSLEAKDWAFYLARGFGKLYITVAIALFILNFVQGEYLLENSPHFQMIKLKRVVQFFIGLSISCQRSLRVSLTFYNRFEF